MGFLTLFLLALALSTDAFAVSVTNGLSYRRIGKLQTTITAFSFGLFQALMPLLGYYTGYAFKNAIEKYDHWIAFALLAGIGANMIFEAIKESKSIEKFEEKEFKVNVLLFQCVATSLDAFAAGIGFAVMSIKIIPAVAFIGATTFVCSIAGIYIGKAAGCALKHKAQLAGGLILIGIGLKILAEDLLL